MAGKITAMSKLKQALQLHQLGRSNPSIASSLGLHKDTVNKYIRQVKEMKVGIKELLLKEDPELERLFNAGNPAYADTRFDELASRLPYLRNELKKKYVTRRLLHGVYKRIPRWIWIYSILFPFEATPESFLGLHGANGNLSCGRKGIC